MRFFPNGSPKTLVFGDVKMLQKFEGYHPQHDSFLQLTPILQFRKLVKPYSFATTAPVTASQFLDKFFHKCHMEL